MKSSRQTQARSVEAPGTERSDWHSRAIHSCHSRRRGGLLMEALIAGIAIGSAAVLATTMLISVNYNRRTAERNLVAVEELNNQLERLSAQDWNQLTTEKVQQTQLSASAAASLPNGELQVTLHEVETPAKAKRLDAQLRWQDRGTLRPPMRMSTWVFAPQEVQ